MCYCSTPEDQILRDLKRGSVPDDALVNSCCWSTICRVRGRHFSEVDPENWKEICRERGYLFSRENPRGF